MTNEECVKVGDLFKKQDIFGTVSYYKDKNCTIRHREDGPAVEYENGDIEWYLNGQYHRENGPAIEYVTGGKRWYKNGKPHREGGPATDLSSGLKEWYIDGKLHREDGPAIERVNGRFVYYLNDVAFNSKEDYLKEVEKLRSNKTKLFSKTYAEDSMDERVVYYKDEKCSVIHREDGPAIQYRYGAEKRWYINGKLHRIDGPAIEHDDGKKSFFLNGSKYSEEEYYKEVAKLSSSKEEKMEVKPANLFTKTDFMGTISFFKDKECKIYHREDGPAREFKDGSKIWCIDGKVHREDGPAIEWDNGDKEWWINGELHREDGPACEFVSGIKLWYKNGSRHREGGPAVECKDGSKEWWVNNKLHREDGPACEYANGHKDFWLNGNLYSSEKEYWSMVNKLKSSKEQSHQKEEQMTKEQSAEKKVVEKSSNNENTLTYFKDTPGEVTLYFKDKECKILHREDGPAKEWKDGCKQWYIDHKLHRETGPAAEWNDGGKEWFINGKHHREGGPAIEYANGAKEWYKNGKLHREDGPAVEFADGNRLYYLNGIRFSSKEQYLVKLECIKGEKSMKEETKPTTPTVQKKSLAESLQDEVVEAGYKLAAMKFIEASKKALQTKSVNPMIANDFVIGVTSGIALNYAATVFPSISKDERMTVLATQLRVSGMQSAGNSVVSSILKQFKAKINTLPQLRVQPRQLVEDVVEDECELGKKSHRGAL